MKLYLAAPYAARDTIRDKATQLEKIGFSITSTWLKEQHEITPGTINAATDLTDEQTNLHVHTDIKDVSRSNLLVLFTNDTAGAASTSGGRHVETGIAMAQGVPVIVVGEPENIFHRSRYCTVVPNWEAALIELAARLVLHERHSPRDREAS